MSKIDWAQFRADFCVQAQKSGFVRQPLMTTPSGPMDVWVRGIAGPLVYLSSGMHGDEPAGPLALLEWMRSGRMSEGMRWAVLPTLNPTGLASATRENAEGIDMNRDYRMKTSAEVTAHSGWLESNSVPDLFVSLHEDWEATGFYLYEIRHGDKAPALTNQVLQAAETVFSLESGPVIDGHEVCDAGWIYHGKDPDEPDGWPEAIFLSHLGCPLSFTMETPSCEPLPKRVACHLAALNGLLSAWMNSAEI